MKSKILGLGLGLTLGAFGVAAVPASAAFADGATPTTCYTGCTTVITSPPPTTPTPQVTTPAPEPKLAVSAGSASLPFTGADIEEMAAVGAGALLVGGFMVRRSRKVRRSAA
ncbi:MAG: hypothetical protein ABSC30_01775 [Acidimicrobiales bacterium]|jgi:hypothetical protein